MRIACHFLRDHLYLRRLSSEKRYILGGFKKFIVTATFTLYVKSMPKFRNFYEDFLNVFLSLSAKFVDAPDKLHQCV